MTSVLPRRWWLPALVYQSTVPGRETSALDLLVDVTAATMAATVVKGRL